MNRIRSRNDLARRVAKRATYDRVLIVCEGRKTEPYYFRELVNNYRLSTVNVQIVGSGADPNQVVREADQIARTEKRKGERFDKVFCIFDRDEHEFFDQASNTATNKKIKPIRSWPCFEFWLFLHFDYSRRPYARSGNRSPATNCIQSLMRYLPNYKKSAPALFQQLQDKLETAITNGKRSRKDSDDTGEDNPSTEIHILVEYLRDLNPD